MGDIQTSRKTDNWSGLCAETGTLCFPDKIQTQLHEEERLFFVKGMLMAPSVPAAVSNDVAQNLQMPMVNDVEEPMPARPTTLKDPGTPDPIVLDWHCLTHFPSQPWCKMFLHIENSRKSTQWCLNFSLTSATWEMEDLCRLRGSSCEQTPLLEPYTRRW